MNSQVLIDRVFLQDLLFLIKQPRTKIDARAVLVFGIERALATPAPIPDADHSEDVRAMVLPDGYKLVPIEPTPAMIQAGIDTDLSETTEEADDYRNVYAAMLSASPAPGDSK